MISRQSTSGKGPALCFRQELPFGVDHSQSRIQVDVAFLPSNRNARRALEAESNSRGRVHARAWIGSPIDDPRLEDEPVGEAARFVEQRAPQAGRKVAQHCGTFVGQLGGTWAPDHQACWSANSFLERQRRCEQERNGGLVLEAAAAGIEDEVLYHIHRPSP
jgi:hypothetical protein